MTRTAALAWIASFAIAACGSDPPSEPAEPEHGDDHGHRDEPEHEKLPTRVRLSPEVIRAAGIETKPVTRATIAKTIELPGEVAADPDRTARVATRLSGTMSELLVGVGEKVEAGQPLATVRAPNLGELRSALASLEAKGASARSNAIRLEALVAKRMASEQELIAARAEADALAAEARAAAQRLRAVGAGKRSRGKAFNFEVRSPIEGVVIERPVVVGEPVVADDVVAYVVSLDAAWFLARVFERDAEHVTKGARVEVRLNAYPDHPFTGKVAYLSHQVDPGARTLTARIPLVNDEDRLRLGLFGTAQVEVAGQETAPALVVPRSAVTKVAGRVVVFVRHPDNDFEIHEVVLGDASTREVQVVHGLREDENVVVTGVFSVKSALLRDSFGEDGH